MEKDEIILKTLKNNKGGIHLQELSRKTGISYSTLCYRIKNSLKEKVVLKNYGQGKKSILTEVYLKK